ncbi:uncharacterized protein KY384_000606 [Bacidia gigantensis]|uniref:uncharacterized protein n=1 Tax=Bacidia gigantensis TaxID=2732470 RepID=UPI001D054BE7|nr:uncharacterized protein KY384_000606 [Bacidia gigantensis]KAG8525846.1 hypothetical protein KY384_000606 [Bacidia gigantensis]
MSRRSNRSIAKTGSDSLPAFQTEKKFERNGEYTNPHSALHTQSEHSTGSTSGVASTDVCGGNANEQAALGDDEEKADSEEEAAIAPSDLAIYDQAGRTSLPANTPIHAIESVALPNEHDQMSDDEIYNAVDLISESDDDNTERQEEDMILDDFTHGFLEPFSDDFIDENLDSTLSQDFSSFDGPMIDPNNDFSASAGLSLDHVYSPSPFQSLPVTPTSRKVRFDDPNTSLTDPATNQEHGLAHYASNLESEDIEDSSGVGMSGYETEGETTDDESIPHFVTKSPRALLHQPSWNEERLSSPISQRRRKRRSGPKLGTFTVDPNRFLGQSNEHDEFVLLMPDRQTDQSKVPNDNPKFQNVEGARICPPHLQPIPVETQPAPAGYVELPGATSSASTDGFMAHILESTGNSDHPTPRPFDAMSADFIATSDLDEIEFATNAMATSDQESDDIGGMDIANLLELTNDSSESGGEAECLKLRDSTMDDNDTGGNGLPKYKLEPLMTPGPSQPRRSPLGGLALTIPDTGQSSGSGSRKRTLSDSLHTTPRHAVRVCR